MYNPFPFDDPKPVNRPALSKETINSIVAGGTPNVAKKFDALSCHKVDEEVPVSCGVSVDADDHTLCLYPVGDLRDKFHEAAAP